MTEPRALIQHSRGVTARQTHRHIPDLREDLLTRDGFDGRNAALYRRHQPTSFRATGRFRNTTFHHSELPATPDGSPRRMFHNEDCAIWLASDPRSAPEFRRNVDGDECWFVHQGTGRVDTEFGPLDFEPGDYLVIPKAVTHRWTHDSPGAVLLCTETVGELRAPTYVGLGRHAPFDPDLVRVPEPCAQASDAPEYEIRVKYGGDHSSIFVDHHPLDVEGWKGDYFPFAFNIRDWNVVMSDSLHLPPSMHVFLVARGVNIINLLPRPFETVRGTERLPFYHRNADYDEVTLLHGGENLGRPLKKGLILHDPQGIHHGYPDSWRERSRREWDEHPRTGWEVIMVETRRPLKIDEGMFAG